MPTLDVHAVLTQAVDATLAELVEASGEDYTVAHHLTTWQNIEYCPEGQHFTSDLMWRLNLFVYLGEKRFMALVGVLPYPMCCDADPTPMRAMVQRLWNEKAFGQLMMDGDLDTTLNAVAQEIEGG